MSIISNSSPLIFLSKIGRMDILNNLFSKVYIPQAVYRETVLANKKDRVSNIISEKIALEQIEVFKVQNELAVKVLTGRLHSGEIEAIIGAKELGVNRIILDDLYARNKAKQLELSVTGTLGVLLLASRQGFIDNIEVEIKNLINEGFRVSSNLIQKVVSEARKNK